MPQRSSTLAIAKTQLPPRHPELLRRPRLIDALYTHLEKQLVLICAPAGYGKTSLLLDWAHDADFPVAWYTIDEFDNVPHTFLAYLIASIRVHFPNFGIQAQAALEQAADTLTSLQSIVAMIANEMFRLPDHLTLILDDYHEIDNPVIDQLIALLIRYAGENCHLFIDSRTLPNIPDQLLLLARRQMGGLSINELKFTPLEVQSLVQQNYGLTMPEQRAKELTQVTDGWITALLLMGHQAGWHQLVQGVISAPEAAGRVYDYLAEQVFAKQSDDVRHFLLGSSILDPLAAETLDRLPGLSYSSKFLNQLLEHQLFVTRLGGNAELYSYHPLFREFLKKRLQRDHPDWCEQLYLVCAQIYATQGQWDRVVEIYLSLGRTDDAVKTLEAADESLRKPSDIAVMTHWVETLPQNTSQIGPHLLSLKGKIHMARGELSQAITYFDRAAQAFQDTDEIASATDRLISKSIALRFSGRYRECIAESDAANALLTKISDHPEWARLCAASLHTRGTAKFYLGDLVNALNDLKQARELFLTTNDLISLANVNNDLGITSRASGHLVEALEYYSAALGLWQKLQYAGAAANTLNNLGYTYLLKGETQEAERILQDALSKAREGGWLRIEALVLATLGDLNRANGDYPQALEFFSDSLQTAQKGHEASLIFYSKLAIGDTHRLTGAMGRAREWLDSAMSSIQVQGSSTELGQLKLTQGLLTADQGQLDLALDYLESAAKIFCQGGNKHQEALAEYYLAHILNLQACSKESEPHLVRVAELVDILGYDHFLVIEGRRTELTLRFASTLRQFGPRFKRILDRVHPLHAPTISRTTLMPSVPALAVHTLGQERIVVNRAEVTQLRPQARELFFFLLVRLATGVRKEELADLFWRDLSAERADGALRITVTRIRKAICPVTLTNGSYALAQENVWYDVHEFEHSLNDAQRAQNAQARIPRLQQAIELYNGDYLSRLEADWVLIERERLRNAYLRALVSLANAYTLVGDLNSALRTFEKASNLEPFLEAAWQGAMQTYLQMGNRAAALAHYEKLKQVLHKEMEIEPSPELQTFFQRIINMSH